MDKKMILDDATRRKISGVLPHKKGSVYRFPIDSFNVEGAPVVPLFKGSMLSPEAHDEASSENIKTTRDAIDYLKKWFGKCGLMGWENLCYSDGSAIEETAESLEDFAPATIWQVFNHIRLVNLGLTTEEKEGLESSPPPVSESSSKTADAAELSPA